MDWKTLFLSADGRIGRKDFWIGWAALFLANFLLGFVPVIGSLFHLASIYFFICLASKRLHDFDKSGWLNLAPYVVGAAALGVMIITGGAAMITAIASGNEGAAYAAGMSAVGVSLLALLVAVLFNLLFLLWIGLSAPSLGDNRYGPPPTALVTFA